jgi:hypothetical protein
MNKLLSTLLFVNLIFTAFAQELPEVPMKNGMAYYKFDHKLDNTANCLSMYFSRNNFKDQSRFLTNYTKITQYTQQFNSNLEKPYKNQMLQLNVLSDQLNLNCLDTMKNVNGFTLNKPMDILWRPLVIEVIRKKVIIHKVTATVVVVFNSKNEYSVIFKDVNYTINWMQGLTNTGMDIYEVGEIYEKLKTSGKVTKDDVKFYEDLNYFFKSADDIILKSLKESYKVDEL